MFNISNKMITHYKKLSVIFQNSFSSTTNKKKNNKMQIIMRYASMFMPLLQYPNYQFEKR